MLIKDFLKIPSLYTCEFSWESAGRGSQCEVDAVGRAGANRENDNGQLLTNSDTINGFNKRVSVVPWMRGVYVILLISIS